MSTPKTFAALLLAGLVIMALHANTSAQNNLTAKGSSLPAQPTATVVESDRVRDGLAGPVRRVRTETAKLSSVGGRATEEKRVLLEVTSYDFKGAKTENQYFPVAGATLTGKEVYKYDEKGNISEMTMVDANGALLSREVYKYDYDTVGNWTRMTTAVAVIEAGAVTFEPTEVTYRSITYYLDQNVLKMAQPSPTAAGNPSPAVKTVATETKLQPPAAVVVKPQPVANSGKPADNRQTGPQSKTAPVLPNARTSVDTTVATIPNAKSPTSADPAKTVVVMSSEPPLPAPKPLLRPVSGGALNGKAITLPQPLYPDPAKRARLDGMVSVDVVVDENGKVISAQATSGPGMLRDAAVQAALKAKFSPTLLSGQPVKVSGVINYKFSLAQ